MPKGEKLRLVSDSCLCSACLKKYGCKDYAMIVSVQSLAQKHLFFGNKDIVIVFQTEKCEKREIRDSHKH